MIEFLVVGLLALSVLCLWLLIEGRKNPKFLAWFIPLLLVLITSTYVTYTSILGYPKVARPEKGVYLKHYVDEPNWIYLWIVNKDNVPMSFQIPYSRGSHQSLEKVEGKTEEGKYMILSKPTASAGALGEETNEDSADGYTIGGDMNFYEWDHESSMQPKE
ncbi:MAG TPA: hypothetical protein EYF95_00195 [Flavobacteriales bacterium]|jgi:hypothetical protein|nr:hypothetical protein [Flavobacteriales bacterium]